MVELAKIETAIMALPRGGEGETVADIAAATGVSPSVVVCALEGLAERSDVAKGDNMTSRDIDMSPSDQRRQARHESRRAQRESDELAHAQGMHDDGPREGCPECDRKRNRAGY